jgi:hypothetical protein
MPYRENLPAQSDAMQAVMSSALDGAPPEMRLPAGDDSVCGLDIRDRETLQHGDIVSLNFIRADCPYVFRRHFRCGLRSHILEVLDPEAVRRETEGEVINGMRWYPKPVPVKMLRIFRRRFCSLAEVAEEIRRLRVIEAYIPSHQLARSNEFIVHYDRGRGCDLMLCGLQEHADGHELAPWRLAHVDVLKECAFRLAESHPSMAPSDITRRLRAEAACFVDGIRRMIMKAGLIPDLAGSRNLLVTKDLTIRLVDINNVSPVHRCDDIYLDDKGYPVCDKSIEALHLLETHLLQRPMTPDDPVYDGFLSPSRMAAVRRLERAFHRTVADVPNACRQEWP